MVRLTELQLQCAPVEQLHTQLAALKEGLIEACIPDPDPNSDTDPKFDLFPDPKHDPSSHGVLFPVIYRTDTNNAILSNMSNARPPSLSSGAANPTLSLPCH